ncbi:pyruvate kinase [Pasteurella multocida]|nr:pyruvate kinase [Pasteurella multocida]MDY0444384.1 pyruvate kinase [Pasteurella multocida]MDY0513175.1 pyruvate kinase [Pasteurella multocida]MDY0527194.1 pyruvate kinase [Pasteurella multocida]
MKAFDLEKALAGEPVVLRDGSKAFVKFEVPKELRENNFADIVGFRIRGNEFIVEEWDIDGVARSSCGHRDIVGMYEEPRPTVTLTLPCPIKTAHHNQEVFKKGNSTIVRFYFDTDRDKHRKMLESGSLFFSEEDAQAWLDAMKNARR